jgi:hypothetical protein
MRYTIHSHLKVKKIDGEFFIYDRANSMLHACNRTATFIFECLQKNIPAADIACLTADRFEVDLANAETDLVQFLNDLEKNNLIEISQ